MTVILRRRSSGGVWPGRQAGSWPCVAGDIRAVQPLQRFIVKLTFNRTTPRACRPVRVRRKGVWSIFSYDLSYDKSVLLQDYSQDKMGVVNFLLRFILG